MKKILRNFRGCEANRTLPCLVKMCISSTTLGKCSVVSQKPEYYTWSTFPILPQGAKQQKCVLANKR